MYLSKNPLPPSVLRPYMGGHTVVGPKGYVLSCAQIIQGQTHGDTFPSIGLFTNVTTAFI